MSNTCIDCGNELSLYALESEPPLDMSEKDAYCEIVSCDNCDTPPIGYANVEYITVTTFRDP